MYYKGLKIPKATPDLAFSLSSLFCWQIHFEEDEYYYRTD